jgi:hypothetical protein
MVFRFSINKKWDVCPGLKDSLLNPPTWNHFKRDNGQFRPVTSILGKIYWRNQTIYWFPAPRFPLALCCRKCRMKRKKEFGCKTRLFIVFFWSQIDSPFSLYFVINSSSSLLVQCFEELERTLKMEIDSPRCFQYIRKTKRFLRCVINTGLIFIMSWISYRDDRANLVFNRLCDLCRSFFYYYYSLAERNGVIAPH